MKKTKLLTISLAVMLYSSSALAQYDEEITFGNRLIDAVDSNNYNIVDAILSTGENANQVGKFDTAPLHRAAVNGNSEIAKLLIENGADVNIRDYGGATPLHISARIGEINFARVLVQNGADINAKDMQGFTPLHRAIVNRQEPISIFFVKAGADVNTTNNDGNTPLMDAIKISNTTIAKELIIAGADKSVRNNSGKDAIDFAMAASNPEIDFLLSAKQSDLASTDSNIPEFLRKEAKQDGKIIAANNSLFSSDFIASVATEKVVEENLQKFPDIDQVYSPKSFNIRNQNVNKIAVKPIVKSEKNIAKNKPEVSVPKIPASMQKIKPVKIEEVKPEKPLEVAPKTKQKIEQKTIENEEVKSPKVSKTKPKNKKQTDRKKQKKIKEMEREVKVKDEVKLSPKIEQKEVKDIAPIALPKLKFIDIPMHIEETDATTDKIAIESAVDLEVKNEPKKAEEAQLKNLANPAPKKLPEKVEEINPKKEVKIVKYLAKKAEVVKAENSLKNNPENLEKTAPALELKVPESMKGKKPTEPTKDVPEIKKIPNNVFDKVIPLPTPKKQLEPINPVPQQIVANSLTFPVTSLQIISLNNTPANTGDNAVQQTVAVNEINFQPVKVIDVAPKFIDFNPTASDIAPVASGSYLPQSLVIKSALEQKSSSIKPVIAKAESPELKESAINQVEEILENIEIEQNLPAQESFEPVANAVKSDEKAETSSDYNTYRASLIDNIKEFYNTETNNKKTFDITNLERRRQETLGMQTNEFGNYKAEDNIQIPARKSLEIPADNFLNSDVIAAPPIEVEQESLNSIIADDITADLVFVKRGLGISFADSGFFAVINGFNSETEAKNYIAERQKEFLDNIKYNVEKISETNMYALKIGAVTDEKSAQILCDILSANNLNCNIK